jgi:hypothetical protein
VNKIDEIALRVAEKVYDCKFPPACPSSERLIQFAHALLVELSKYAEPEDTSQGFRLWLDREAWGHVIDGLMLERERSLQRKSSNPESNSNCIADRCAELITAIRDKAAPVIASEQKPVGYLWKWNDGILDDAHPRSGWNYSLEYPEMHPSNVNKIEVVEAFTSPPNTADIEQRVAEAIVRLISGQKGYYAKDIRSGDPWKVTACDFLIKRIMDSQWREYL